MLGGAISDGVPIETTVHRLSILLLVAGLESVPGLRHDHPAFRRRGKKIAGKNAALCESEPREGSMTTRIDRRQFQALLGWGAAAIALSEMGLARPAWADDSFTVASTGASWGEGLRAAFIDGPKFEEANKIKVTQEFGIDSVITAKAMASCGNP